MISLSDLKDRKVGRWALAYLAGAWLLLQVLNLVADRFGWPDAWIRGLIVVLAVGLPAVLVVAWYHGERGLQRVSGVEVGILTALLAIAGTGVTLLGGGAEAASAPDNTSLVAVETAVEQASVAVLPFDDMSPDGDQAYFSDGLSEELLNVLAKIPGLRVAARTSSFSFKGTNTPIDSVGRALRVAHVLEGSVRKAGDRIRITAQLIDARTGYHLWSETYDRDLADVFAVQDEISRAIVDELRVTLTGGAPLVLAETADPEAHTLVLRALALERDGTRAGSDQALRLLQTAIDRDPGYARAHATLASILAQRAYAKYSPPDETYAAAQTAAARALELDPENSEAHAALGRVADLTWDFEAAAARFERALAANPSDVRAHYNRAFSIVRLGRSQEAVRLARRAVELDPVSSAAFNNLGVVLSYTGQERAAVEALTAALALSPDSYYTYANLGLSYSDLGRHREAIAAAERAVAADAEDQFSLSYLAFVYGKAGRRADAEGALRRLRALPDLSPYLVATAHAGLGDRDAVFRELARAVATRDDLAPDLSVDPVFNAFHGDPRMDRLLRQIGLPAAG